MHKTFNLVTPAGTVKLKLPAVVNLVQLPPKPEPPDEGVTHDKVATLPAKDVICNYCPTDPITGGKTKV